MAQSEKTYFPFRDLFVLRADDTGTGLAQLHSALQNGQVQGVHLMDFVDQDLAFLEHIESRHLIRSLSFQFCRQVKLPRLAAFPALCELNIMDEGRKLPLDLAELSAATQLRYLYANWGKGLANLSTLKQVLHLNLQGAKLKKLVGYGLPAQLISLILDGRHLEELTGLQDLQALRSLNLGIGSKIREFVWPAQLQVLYLSAPQLQAISQLKAMPELYELHLFKAAAGFSLQDAAHFRQLHTLELSSLKEVREWCALSACHNLRSIVLENCASIPDIAWLKPLSGLEHFCSYGTVIADGNLHPLATAAALKVTGFDNKKHYSHTQQALDYIISQRRQNGDLTPFAGVEPQILMTQHWGALRFMPTSDGAWTFAIDLKLRLEFCSQHSQMAESDLQHHLRVIDNLAEHEGRVRAFLFECYAKHKHAAITAFFTTFSTSLPAKLKSAASDMSDELINARIQALTLTCISFYDAAEAYQMVWDYTLENIAGEHVIAVKFDWQGQILGLSMES